MKTKMIAYILLLLPFLMGVSCKKESSEITSIQQKLIGKWEWIETFQSGFNWHITAKKTGSREEMDVTESNVKIIRDGNIFLEGRYNITKEKGLYFMKISTNILSSQDYNKSIKRQVLFNNTFDTLHLNSNHSETSEYSQYEHYSSIVYKKISN